MIKISRVVVLGTGTMGSGIIQVIAQSGYRVKMQDISDYLLSRAQQRIEKSLSKLVEKKKISVEEKDNILSRIVPGTSLDVVSDADLIIEAVPEQLDLKVGIFGELDKLAPKHAILASNTSSLPITAIAAATKRPQQVIGMHFMNPVPVMRGVELIRGRVTSQETIDSAVEFTCSINKIPVVAQDYAGFITSRVLNAYLNEAAYTVMDGNTPKDVDDAMVYCTNMPQGPCALMDLVGIDVIVYVLGILENEFGPKFKAAPLLRQMMRAGHLGRKSGRGFYEY
ncbi:MAG: 3-hydroxybutyryl-CoA dehydrogenase [Peptococcaceae bacterium BRH_c4a]|nr:MAG: 3-hydroxybutyryl-CoA dehydrogenase [Peptococcaceae bacterium BRH_c4a]